MTEFRTQAEAVRAAREFFWGTVTFAKRECIVPAPIVTAKVNKRDVLIDFDNFGRLGAYKIQVEPNIKFPVVI